MLFVDYVIKSKKSYLYDLISKCDISKRKNKTKDIEEINFFDKNDSTEVSKYEQKKLLDLKNNSISLLYDLSLCFNELTYLNIKALYVTKCIDYDLSCINDVDTLSKLKDMLNNLYEKLDIYCGNINDNLNKYSFTSNISNYNEEVTANHKIIEGMLSKINASRKINVFDTKCRRGKILDYINNNFTANTYGLEIINDEAERAKKIATKIAKGDLPGCNITNNVFDVLIATSSLSFDKIDNMSIKSLNKMELKYLEQSFRYLNKAGLFIFVIPAFRMHKDICMYIARRFKDVYICKDKGDNCNLVYIIGRKKGYDFDFDQDTFLKLRSCYNYENIPSFNLDDICNYDIESCLANVKTFKGSVTDYDEYYNIANNSGLMDEFYNNQKVEKIHETNKRPLLPFTIGQIGLILTSGCLDGLIDEGNDYCHLIKGRVAKKIRNKEDIDETRNTKTKTEIFTNNVEINVLLPDGEFKNLA